MTQAPGIFYEANRNGIAMPVEESYKDKPIDYIDPAPKPLKIVIPFIEYVERVKRIKLDAWQRNFCQRLEDAAVGRTKERVWAVIHAEGQLGKSIILVQAFSAWLLGHDPLHRIALATYNVTRSQRHSKVVIGIMNLPVHKEIFPNPDGWVDEKTSKEKWSTTARIALNDGQDSFNPVGLQSGLTGSGFDTLLIDDPYADQKEAFSETTRTNLQEFWDFTVMSRMGTHTNVFGMFHRYHVEDLAGYLLDKGSFDYWRYATICDGPYINDETGQKFDDPLGRKEGEYISPERRPPSYYTDARKNSRVWNSMFQGRPSSEEGEFFKVGEVKHLSHAEAATRRQECTIFVRAWDLAATEEGGDYSVAPLIGMSPDKRTTVFDVVRKQVESAGRDQLMLETAQRDGYDVVIKIPQDPGAAGKTTIFHVQQLLKGYQVVVAPTSGSKADRARPWASAVNSGEVEFAPDDHLPPEDQWIQAMTREMRNFPLSEHDDCIDSGADGYNECYERVTKGLVLKNYRPQTAIRTWGEFCRKFRITDTIPADFTIYAAVTITPEANRPNSAVIVVRPPQREQMPDTLFLIAEYKEWTDKVEGVFEWLHDTLQICETPKAVTVWLHPDSESFRPVIWQKLKCPVMIFAGDDTDGISEMNWYLQELPDQCQLNDTQRATRLYGLITDESQLMTATDNEGLVAFRQEAASWGYNDKGEPTQVGAVLQGVRMICHSFHTTSRAMTTIEQIIAKTPDHLKDPEDELTAQQKQMWLQREHKEQERMKRERMSKGMNVGRSIDGWRNARK